MAGQRRPLTTAYAPRLQPLLVTSLGRMGTTLLMRMLAAHPGVVTYDRPPYEARGGKYWLHVLKTLAAPADASKRVGAPMEFHLEPLAAGGNPFYSAAFAAWPEVEAWSGSTTSSIWPPSASAASMAGTWRRPPRRARPSSRYATSPRSTSPMATRD